MSVCVCALTMVNEGSRAQPELSTALARGVHHAEVVHPCPQEGAVGWAQLRDAPLKHLHTLTRTPAMAPINMPSLLLYTNGGGGGHTIFLPNFACVYCVACVT